MADLKLDTIHWKSSVFSLRSSPVRGLKTCVAKTDYKARCHCGQVRFSFRTEPITTGKRCNCSICVRKGAVMSATYIPAADFTPIENSDPLTDYRWNDRVVGHIFCKTCGIYPYHGDADYGYRVNLGCVEGLDIFALEVGMIDGRSMPLAANPGNHPNHHHHI